MDFKKNWQNMAEIDPPVGILTFFKRKRQTAYTDVRIKRSTGKGTKPPTRTSSYKFISGPDKSIWPFGNPSNQDTGHSGRKTKQNRGPK